MNTEIQETTAFWSPQLLTGQTHSFVITASPQACVGPTDHQFFMGGAAMATAIDAMQRSLGKPLLWATTHFLNQGMLGEQFHVDVQLVAGGRSVSQAMTTLSRGDKVLQRTIAALGVRHSEPDRQFIHMPNVIAPNDCPVKKHDAFSASSPLIKKFERRTALEDSEAGLEHMWVRPRFTASISAPLLSLISDFFLGSHERSRGGTSLDNTFRLCALQQTDWVLCVAQAASFSRGVMHGTQHMFAKDGTLLATSSQTGLLPHTPSL